MKPLLQVQSLSKVFTKPKGLLRATAPAVHAVDSVSFDLYPGQTLGIVGESGCGKSTLGRTITRLYEPTAGRILFQDQDFSALPKNTMRTVRKNMQMIFQDPYASLNPRMTVRQIIDEPLRIHTNDKAQTRTTRIEELLTIVGLRPESINRFPHEFSGGQRQRIGIARAIALKPSLVICDEAVSALDVSIQSQILNLLVKLQRELGLTYIFISHDLGVVKYVSDRVGVMYLGRIVEMADTEAIYSKPQHPYTKALLSAAPHPNPRHRSQRQILQGEVPSPSNPPAGCHFHTRCAFAIDRCRQEIPALQARGADPKHITACHRVGEI